MTGQDPAGGVGGGSGGDRAPGEAASGPYPSRTRLLALAWGPVAVTGPRPSPAQDRGCVPSPQPGGAGGVLCTVPPQGPPRPARGPPTGRVRAPGQWAPSLWAWGLSPWHAGLRAGWQRPFGLSAGSSLSAPPPPSTLSGGAGPRRCPGSLLPHYAGDPDLRGRGPTVFRWEEGGLEPFPEEAAFQAEGCRVLACGWRQGRRHRGCRGGGGPRDPQPQARGPGSSRDPGGTRSRGLVCNVNCGEARGGWTRGGPHSRPGVCRAG